MLGDLVWNALSCYGCLDIWFGLLGIITTIYHFVFEDITDLPFIKTVQVTAFQFKHEFVL
jgi:hypothetical protein